MVVLQKERVLAAWVPRDLVHALAEFRKRIGQEVSLHARVRNVPRLAPVRRLINASGRDRDLQVVRVVGIRDYRVHRQPAESRRPLFAMGVIPKPAVERPRRAVVVRFKNGTDKTLTNISVIGCDERTIQDLQSGQSEIEWIPITESCIEHRIVVRYQIEGIVQTEVVDGYVINGRRINHQMGDERNLIVE